MGFPRRKTQNMREPLYTVTVGFRTRILISSSPSIIIRLWTKRQGDGDVGIRQTRDRLCAAFGLQQLSAYLEQIVEEAARSKMELVASTASCDVPIQVAAVESRGSQAATGWRCISVCTMGRVSFSN